MGDVVLFRGQAGTGKTHELIKAAADRANRLDLDECHRVLFVTRMHGARRRLAAKLAQVGFDRPYSLMTLDSLALQLVNRWRRVLGLPLPVTPVGVSKDFETGEFSVEAGFDEVVAAACRLLGQPVVADVVGAAYPLVVIDEFQDCTSVRLDLVKALVERSAILAASDAFQVLEAGLQDCPGEEWVASLGGAGELVELETIHRTTNEGVLSAARALRQDEPCDHPGLPVFSCPGHGLAAWRILSRLVLCSPANRWTGMTALISPSRDPVIDRILQSCDSQLAKQKLGLIRWRRELPAAKEEDHVFEAIRRELECDEDQTEEEVHSLDGATALAVEAIRRARRISRIRGLSAMPDSVIRNEVVRLLNEKRAYGREEPGRLVVTVHGAKNREFDNVFVLWPYRILSDADLQRRLLYNAITRSKVNCEVLILRKDSSAKADPVLSLIPPPQPAFPAKKSR